MNIMHTDNRTIFTACAEVDGRVVPFKLWETGEFMKQRGWWRSTTDCSPGIDVYAVEAFERMVDGGVKVTCYWPAALTNADAGFPCVLHIAGEEHVVSRSYKFLEEGGC